jgi:hypothetical protein
MARTPSQEEIAAFIVGHGITDFVTGGRLSLIERNALWKVVKKLGVPAARATPSVAGRLAGTAVGATRFVVMRHPYIAAAVVTYEAVKHRDQIAQLAREGWEVIQETGAAMAPIVRTEFDRLITEGPRPSPGRGLPGVIRARRRTSKFNKAISAGMKAVKRSKFLGKPGKFTNSKKAFATVTKTVSRLRKGAKVSSKGALGTIKRAVKRYI